MTAVELATAIREAPGRVVPAGEVEIVLTALEARGKVAARAIMTAAGVEGHRPAHSMRDLLQRVRNRLTARERAELRNSC